MNNCSDLGTGMKSRSISFENPSGEPGRGVRRPVIWSGRKGFPAKGISAGRNSGIMQYKSPGAIHHIWMTGGFRNNNAIALRSMVVRAYWGKSGTSKYRMSVRWLYGSAQCKDKFIPVSCSLHRDQCWLNIWLPMPFSKNARITLTNEGDENITLFYQIDYTVK